MTLAHVNTHEVAHAVSAVAVVEDDSVTGAGFEHQQEVEPREGGAPEPGVAQIG